MAERVLLYHQGGLELARIDPEAADLRVLLVQPSYQPNPRHRALDDETGTSPSAHELTVDGYARQVLGGRRLVLEADGTVYLDALDTEFGELDPGERIAGALVYLERGSDRLSIPILFHPTKRIGGRAPGTTGGPVIFTWAPAAEGRVLRLRQRA